MLRKQRVVESYLYHCAESNGGRCGSVGSEVWTVRGWNPGLARFFSPDQLLHGARPASCKVGTSLSREKSARNVLLTPPLIAEVVNKWSCTSMPHLCAIAVCCRVKYYYSCCNNSVLCIVLLSGLATCKVDTAIAIQQNFLCHILLLLATSY